MCQRLWARSTYNTWPVRKRSMVIGWAFVLEDFVGTSLEFVERCGLGLTGKRVGKRSSVGRTSLQMLFLAQCIVLVPRLRVCVLFPKAGLSRVIAWLETRSDRVGRLVIAKAVVLQSRISKSMDARRHSKVMEKCKRTGSSKCLVRQRRQPAKTRVSRNGRSRVWPTTFRASSFSLHLLQHFVDSYPCSAILVMLSCKQKTRSALHLCPWPSRYLPSIDARMLCLSQVHRFISDSVAGNHHLASITLTQSMSLAAQTHQCRLTGAVFHLSLQSSRHSFSLTFR